MSIEENNAGRDLGVAATQPTRIPDAVIARYPNASRPPAPHTSAELHRVLALLHALDAGTIVIGHGRHRASIAAADALTTSWLRGAGTVLDTVSWPTNAASWLRPARRLAVANVDAVIIADVPAGFAQVTQRLRREPNWSTKQAIGFAGLAHPDLISLTGTDLLGMTGATMTGRTWRVGQGLIIVEGPTGIAHEPARRTPARRDR